MKNIFLFLVGLLFLSSCKYKTAGLHLGNDSIVEISIPVIKQDPSGILRNALAKEISLNKTLRYKTSKAKYQLKVNIEEDNDSTICYMWDRNPANNQRLNVFYNTEGKKEVIAKTELVNAKTGEVVVGPYYLNASVIYDFVNPTVEATLAFQEPTGENVSMLQYSLGQLDSEEGAQEEAYSPAYKLMAEKIISVLIKNSKKTIK
jgi:hypothetical protein